MRSFLLTLTLTFVLAGCATTDNLTEDSYDQEEVMISAKNYSGLVDLYTKKLKDNDTIPNREKIVYYYSMLKDYESSAFYLDAIIKSGKATPKNIYDQSINYYKLGRMILSETLINNAISKDNTNAAFYNHKGILLSKKGEYKNALFCFNKARELFYPSSKVQNNIALLWYKQKNYSKALEILMPIYIRNTNDKMLNANLVLILAKLQDRDYVFKILESKYNMSNKEAINAYNLLSEQY